MTRALIFAATMCDAVLAGTGLDRVVVQMPAWRIVGAVGWGAYSRHADLGNGLILYPVAAIGGCALSIAAAISYGREQSSRASVANAFYFGAMLTLLGLLLTIKAAPIMLSIRTVGEDAVTLQRAFDAFDWWGTLRAVVQGAAFVANLWACTLTGRRTR